MIKKTLCMLCMMVMILTACQNQSPENTSESQDEETGITSQDQVEEEVEPVAIQSDFKYTIDTQTTYQTIESFGTSGAWWSQYVGGWDNIYKDTGMEVRDLLAQLLFDPVEGIGLTAYRYNVGAGSKESGKGVYWDVNRRASSFETAPGEYDWNRDANAVWFLNRAVHYGAEEVIFFCNSPLERLTINGTAQVTKGEKSNINPENYPAFAKYVLDVTDHFVEAGIPVKYVSPINEPQWDWVEGQEGCHYEPSKLAGVYRAFLEALETRDTLQGVKLSGPESGEWGNEALSHTSALLNDQVLSEYFEEIDNHSYWTDAATKAAFKRWMDAKYPDVKLRTSEWCEMVNGSDVTMDSAYNLSKVIVEDLTILNVVSWQNWVGIAPGGYRDGLIYVNQDEQVFNPLIRLWAFGNYSRYIRPGYVRVDLEEARSDLESLMPVAFKGSNEAGVEELVIVVINPDGADKTIALDFAAKTDYNNVHVYETSENRDLEVVLEQAYDGRQVITIGKESVSTIVLSKGGN